MNRRITLPFILLSAILAMHSACFAELLESSLNASDVEQNSTLVFSRPTTIEVIQSEEGLYPSNKDYILQIKMELVDFDIVGNRISYIRFSKKYITEYIIAIESFLSMARGPNSSSLAAETPIASLLSCDTLKGQQFLVFKCHRIGASLPYLSIGTTFDLESKGGVHYFSPADAQELVNLLIKFAHS
jgi:hypothetical protein